MIIFDSINQKDLTINTDLIEFDKNKETNEISLVLKPSQLEGLSDPKIQFFLNWQHKTTVSWKYKLEGKDTVSSYYLVARKLKGNAYQTNSGEFIGRKLKQNPSSKSISLANIIYGQKKHGYYVRYYPNGKKALELDYFLGMKHGAQKEWDEKGNLMAQMNWKYGLLQGRFQQWENNVEIIDAHFKNDKKHGWVTRRNKNGTTKDSIEYSNNVKNGGAFLFFKSGNLKKEEHYKNDVLSGNCIEYFQNYSDKS